MGRIYDNWERLVRTTVRREKDKQLARQDSLSSSSSSSASSSFDLLGLPLVSFSHDQIVHATSHFSKEYLIKQGLSDLFKAQFEDYTHPVVIRRIGPESVSTELDFYSRISGNRRFLPLLGNCLERLDDEEKFLVYKYMPNGDLSNFLLKKSKEDDDSMPTLDWITRSKIAIGAAEGLTYLHHECYPPVAHGYVQASSIFLDDKFEVRLGSPTWVYPKKGEELQESVSTRKYTSGAGKVTRKDDVYCFGKVLLELVTGEIDIRASPQDMSYQLIEEKLPYINTYDIELVIQIIDPRLIIDEDLIEEVWAMAIVAKSCLHPNPAQRPQMRNILRSLENPLKVIREEEKDSEEDEE